MKYADVTLGEMEALINKMGGLEAKDRFMRGELRLVDTGRYNLSKCSTWGMVNIGKRTSPQAYRAVLHTHGVRCTGLAENILEGMHCSPRVRTCELILLSVFEIGLIFNSGYSLKNILANISAAGMACPAEVGPVVAYEYPRAASLGIRIAMDPYKDRDGPLMFALGSDEDGAYLGALETNHFCAPSERMLLMRHISS